MPEPTAPSSSPSGSGSESRSATPQSRRRARRPSSGRSAARHAGVLHPLAAVLALAQRQRATAASGSAQRRQRQRLAVAQRLLDPLPAALISPAAASDRFWTVLRWGGLGLFVAKLLQR